LKIEFDEGWELHIRIHNHYMAAGPPGKKQPRYSIRHTHAHKLTYMEDGTDWLVRDVPWLFKDMVKCKLCGDKIPEALHGSMRMTTWSMKDVD
jgi:hypothetical protein